MVTVSCSSSPPVRSSLPHRGPIAAIAHAKRAMLEIDRETAFGVRTLRDRSERKQTPASFQLVGRIVTANGRANAQGHPELAGERIERRPTYDVRPVAR